MTKTSLILIPPSEGKTSGGKHPPLKKIHPLTKELHKQLTTEKNQEKLLGVKGNKLEESIQANKHILKSATFPAIERYSGVVYDGIDYQTLKQKKFFDSHVRIVSALFGVVKPQDLLPDYKLKIEKLKADKLWLEENSQQLKNHFIIDLLPKTHRKAISYDDGIEVEFTIIKNGKKIPAGHNGKFIKGRFVRWLVENKITDPNEFKKFKEDDFSWNGKEFIKKI